MGSERSSYWMSRSARVTRRGLIRGGVTTGIGLTAAALIGCGSGDDDAAPATQAPSGGAAATTAPGGGTAAPAGTAATAAPERPGVPVVAGEPKYGGTWALTTTATLQQHDMHTALAATVFHIMGERALELDEWTGDLRANVAESWEVADPTSLILKVRPGIKTHDRAPWNGRAFDAEDLAFNLNRIAGLTADEEAIPLTAFQRASTLAGMDRAEATDAQTVSVKMKAPTSTFFRGLTEIRNQLMPREVVEVGFADPLKLGGFGPYMVTEFEPGVKEVYEKHPHYYREGEPYFDKIVRNVVPDATAAVAAFISKQSSLFSGSKQDFETIQAARKDANRYEYTGVNWFHIRPNVKHGAFGDFRVRKAIQLSLNYEEIGDGYYGPGWTWTAAFHPFYPEAYPVEKVKTLAGYNPATKDADRAEAAKMLAAAGHENGKGVEFEVLHQIGDVYKENGLRMQDQLAKLYADMKVEIKSPPDAATYAKQQSDRNFQAVSYTITTLPDIVLEGISQYHSKGSRNYGNWENADTDAMLDKALGELDPNARKEIMLAFQDKFMTEWQPLIQLYIDPERYMVQGNIGGFDTTAGPWGFTGYRVFNKAGRWYEIA